MNKPCGILGVARDISDRKRTEDALRESESKYRQLVKHAPAGIYEVDLLNRKFITVNDVMCEYTGFTREEFLTLNPLDSCLMRAKACSWKEWQRSSQGKRCRKALNTKSVARMAGNSGSSSTRGTSMRMGF